MKFRKFLKALLGDVFIQSILNHYLNLIITWLIKRLKNDDKFKHMSITDDVANFLLNIDVQDFINDNRKQIDDVWN